MEHKPIIVVHGKRIDLGLMDKAYLPKVMEIINDARVAQFITAVPPMYFPEEEKWIESLVENKKNVVFAILRKDKDGNHEYIGHMGIHPCSDVASRVAVTGAIIGYEYLNQGYGSEAKMLQLFYAFRFLNIRKIRSDVLSVNPRSCAYLEKSGYSKVAVFKDELMRNGKLCDEIHYELFPKDWDPIWEAYKKKHSMEDPF